MVACWFLGFLLKTPPEQSFAVTSGSSSREFLSDTDSYELTFMHRLNISYANEKEIIKHCMEEDLNFSLPDSLIILANILNAEIISKEL